MSLLVITLTTITKNDRKAGAGMRDYTSWEEDLKSNPKLTIECLRALKRSWDRGGYGALEEIDWRAL